MISCKIWIHTGAEALWHDSVIKRGMYNRKNEVGVYHLHSVQARYVTLRNNVNYARACAKSERP